MERIKRMKLKAEEDKRITDLEIERLEKAESYKEVELMDERRKEAKLQTQIDHEAYLENQQLEQDIRAYEKSDEGRKEALLQEGIEKTEREINEGLTWEERKYKHMNSTERRECNNMIASGEIRDVKAYIKWKRLQREASERRRRKLKGM